MLPPGVPAECRIQAAPLVHPQPFLWASPCSAEAPWCLSHVGTLLGVAPPCFTHLGVNPSVLPPPAARPFHSWHTRLAVMSKGLSLVGFFCRYFLQPRVQHSPCTSDVTAKANPSINPMFLVLYSLSLTSIYLHSKAPGELSDLKRLESARKDEFPFTTGRLRK